MNYTEILVPSTLDGSAQPSLFFKAEGKNRPLLVGLHTWSYNRFNQIDNMLPLAEKHGFNLLLPEFRGANLESNPRCKDACGSSLARQDVKDAIDYLLKTEDIDQDNIFLLGLSGGGHMALLVAADHPKLFKAVGAFVPVTDLEKWADENENYRRHVLACCETKEEMAARSPITYAARISGANLKIFHGKYDTVVPFTHSTRLFEEIMKINPRSTTYLDIFDGGHEIDMQVAEQWIISQYKKTAKTAVTG